jgi:phosphate:Na+ symporter
MSVILLLLAVAGSTALFLYGLKLMSESLQKIMGQWLQLILSSISSNRFKGILIGIFVTALIQSSSATTVMVVSFVNAGMLNFTEAICVIMGANIGTTLTAWLIAIFGFELNFAAFTLPLIGISIPLIFANNRKVKNWGEMLLGFSLLFISLGFLKSTIPTVTNSWLLDAISYVRTLPYLSYVTFFAFGIVCTILVRSSNATFALILVLCYQRWISFDLAVSMVLGINVGTTIAAIDVAKVANVTAKRVALARMFFNLFGAVWAISIFPYLIKGTAILSEGIGIGNPLLDTKAIPLSLALFHTSFHVLNTLILVQFVKRISQMVTKRIPLGLNGDNEFKLTHIKIGLLSTPDASLFQAKRETIVSAENVRKMYMSIEKILFEKHEKEYNNLKEGIHSKEVFADRIEKEIANYLTKVGEGRLSENSSKMLRALYEIIADIESIANTCSNMLNIIERKRAHKIEFPEPVNNNVQLMFNMVQEALDTMVTMLAHEENLPLSMAQETETEINNFRDILKNEHLENLEKGVYNYDAGILYTDIVSQCEKIGDFAFNIDKSYKSLS